MAIGRGRRRQARLLGSAAMLAGIVVLVLISQVGGGGREKGGDGPRPPQPPCPETNPPSSQPGTYETPPDTSILEQGADLRAVVSTTCGDIEIDLLEAERPQAVANFVFLTEEGFFDGLRFPRVEPNFLIQTGDPNGELLSEPDDPGYALTQEPPLSPKRYVYGTVAWASTGSGETYGSQFFIILHKAADGDLDEPAGLKKHYTIFGVVDPSSYETIEKIASIDTVPSADPLASVEPVVDVYVTGIEIVGGQRSP